MHTSIRPLACVALVSFMGACSDDPDDVVTTRSSPSADFSSYETFRFMTESDLGRSIDLPTTVAANLDEVNEEMREELLQEGLREVGPDEAPDLFAFSLATTEQESALYWSCVDGYWYGYWTMAWEPCVWLDPVYTEYLVGSIVVGLADPVRQEVVFGSLIQGVIDGSGDMDEARISNDMDEVFDDYPN